eukprot:767254-Hanusia_phi.AAC.3
MLRIATATGPSPQTSPPAASPPALCTVPPKFLSLLMQHVAWAKRSQRLIALTWTLRTARRRSYIVGCCAQGFHVADSCCSSRQEL